RELVERQPLAEYPVRCQTPRYSVVHLTGIEIPRVGMPGDEEISHDDIKAVTTGGQVATAIVKHEAHVRAGEQLPVPGGKMCARRPCELGHELNNGGLRHAERGTGTGRDSRSEPDEGDPARVRMEEQRQQPLAALVGRHRTATQHVVVIKSELEVVA